MKRGLESSVAGSQPRRIRREMLTRVRENTNRGLLLTLAVTGVVLVLGGLWSHARVSKEMKGALARELTTLLETEVVALRNWYDERRQLVQRAAREPALRVHVQRLRSAEPAVRTEARAEIAAHVAPLIERRDLVGYLVVGPTGRILTSSLAGNTAERLPPEIAAHIAPVFEGQAVATRPVMADGRPVILLAGPVPGLDGTPTAALVLKERPEKHFTRIVQGGRSGATGSTYAFDQSGVMLSQGRTDDFLQAQKLLERDQSSMLNLVLRNPGENLVEGGQIQGRLVDRPLTRMAADATKGQSGFDVDGYRDYRGVEVVGAWAWLNDYDFGLATETEAVEAFRPLRALEAVFAVLLALVIFLALASIAATALFTRSREQAAEALDAVKTLGQYTLGDLLGEGSMGAVYRATHAMLRRPTAVKVLRTDVKDPNARTRFTREVQLTAQLTHPNTIAVFDYGQTPEGRFYYAMEYIDGVDLQRLVDAFGPLPPARTVHILEQIALSLEEAHAVGLIHRDVKPSNVMITRRGLMEDVVKVLDFGLAKRVDTVDPDITLHNKVVGTPRYMSPEAIRGKALDARADVYSLGAVGYFLLTGRAVFEGSTALEVFRGHLDQAVVPLHRVAQQPVPESLAALIEQALEKDREDRQANIREFIEELYACVLDDEWDADAAALWWATHREADAL